MRRILLIFLMLIFPLQASWAAVSSYCQHESGLKAKHFGHHEHQHQSKASDPVKEKSKLVVDNDCAACHLYSAGTISNSISTTFLSRAEAEPVSSHIEFSSVLRPERPERPKWVRAV